MALRLPGKCHSPTTLIASRFRSTRATVVHAASSTGCMMFRPVPVITELLSVLSGRSQSVRRRLGNTHEDPPRGPTPT